MVRYKLTSKLFQYVIHVTIHKKQCIYVDLYPAFSVAVEFDINQLFIEYCLHELGKYKQKFNHL